MAKEITFKGAPVHLTGELPRIGDKIRVKGTDNDFQPFSLKAKRRPTIVSTFPSINTSVCDTQTKRIVELAQAYPKVNFVAISLDLPTAQKQWCAANGVVPNIVLISDYQKRAFSKKYGLLIDELKLMGRSLMVLDQKGLLKFIYVCPEVAELPDFEAAESALKSLLS